MPSSRIEPAAILRAYVQCPMLTSNYPWRTASWIGSPTSCRSPPPSVKANSPLGTQACKACLCRLPQPQPHILRVPSVRGLAIVLGGLLCVVPCCPKFSLNDHVLDMVEWQRLRGLPGFQVMMWQWRLVTCTLSGSFQT
jgi:hypothetical protein